MSKWLTSLNAQAPVVFEYKYNDEIGQLADDIWSSQNRLGELLKVQDNLLNAISELIVTVDEKLIITYCNPRVVEWVGIENELIVGQPVDFIFQLQEGSIEKIIRQAILDDQQHTHKVTLTPFNQDSPISGELNVTHLPASSSTVLVIGRT